MITTFCTLDLQNFTKIELDLQHTALDPGVVFKKVINPLPLSL